MDQEGDDPETPIHNNAFPDGALAHALRQLKLFGDDAYLSMQATNMGIVDQFCTELERNLLQEYWRQDGTPVAEAAFLSAQSQMWMFAVYEALRTWRERASKVIAWAKNGHLAERVTVLRQDLGYQHPNRLMRAAQFERIVEDLDQVGVLEADLRRIHTLFTRLDFLRVSLAKHEIKGERNSVAYAPGYGRINMWTGALDYELTTGPVSFGPLSRRDVADELRGLFDGEAPSPESITEFDQIFQAALTGQI